VALVDLALVSALVDLPLVSKASARPNF